MYHCSVSNRFSSSNMCFFIYNPIIHIHYIKHILSVLLLRVPLFAISLHRCVSGFMVVTPLSLIFISSYVTQPISRRYHFRYQQSVFRFFATLSFSRERERERERKYEIPIHAESTADYYFMFLRYTSRYFILIGQLDLVARLNTLFALRSISAFSFPPIDLTGEDIESRRAFKRFLHCYIDLEFFPFFLPFSFLFFSFSTPWFLF